MREKRSWHWVDWVLFGIYTLLSVMNIVALFTKPERLGFPDPATFIVQVIVCYAVPLLFWRPGYVRDGLFSLTLLFTAGIPALLYAYSNHSIIGLILVPTIIVGYLSKPRTMVWTIPVYIAVIPIALQVTIGKVTFGDIIYRMFDYGLMYGIGYSLNRIVQSNNQLKQLFLENQKQYGLIQEQNKALEQYAKQIEQLTLLEERNRMARELHDTVGHTFTSVIVGMDAVSYLIEGSPAKAKEKLDVLLKVTRSGLEEVRRSIHQIAPDETGDSLQTQLTHLATEFAVHTGMQVELTSEGKEPELSKQIKLTLIRCLQESLTNAKRHGRAANIAVRLVYDSNQTLLIVKDDGIGTDNLMYGFGLKAMTDRVLALRGSLSAQSQQGQGTVIQCMIPHHSYKEEIHETRTTHAG